MINAIAIDDEPLALGLISSYCAENPDINLQKTFTSPGDALTHLKKHPVDLIFLDVQMPEILGTDFARKLDSSVMIIFSTAYSNYALEGFELEAVDFLLKPYDLDRFNKAIDKAKVYYNYLHEKATSTNPYIFMRSDYSLQKIELNDLLYIEGLEDYVKFHFKTKPTQIFRATMKSLVDKLPENQFVRVHRSYIVRMDKVSKLSGTSLIINNTEINVGRMYKEQAFESFNKYSSGETQ